MTAFNSYEAGFLMEDGAMADQTALYPSLMYTIKDELENVKNDNRLEEESISNKGQTPVSLNPAERLNAQGGLNRADLQPVRVNRKTTPTVRRQ